MGETYETYKEKNGNRIIKIMFDEYPDNPRDWDNVGVMITSHGNYTSPDELGINFDDFKGWGEIEEHLFKEHDAALVLPIYMYDHSGVALNTTGFSCPWDSGQYGLIMVTNAKLKEEGISKEKAKSILENEVETFGNYINGDVLQYVLYEIKKVKVNKVYQDGSSKDYEEEELENVDSCCGFYGTSRETIQHIFESAGLNIDDFEEVEEK